MTIVQHNVCEAERDLALERQGYMRMLNRHSDAEINYTIGKLCMANKQRIDSTTAAVQIMAKASQPIMAPSNVPLEDCDMGFFASVLDEFARSEWTAHQLELAAMLSRTMADLESEQRLLRKEGSVAFSTAGMPCSNPRRTIVQMHVSSILSFRRSLALHARATRGEGRDIGKRRAAAKGIEAGAAADDGLLARPQ